MTRSIANGFSLWRLSWSYEAIITDATLAASVFGLLHRLPRSRRPRHLVLECLFERPSTFGARVLKSLQIRAALTRFTRAVVYSRKELDAFSRCFQIPRERFVFIPYHTTLHWYDFSKARPNIPRRYAFAGGESNRDYRTFFAAIDGLGVDAIVAVRDRSILEGIRVPSNVELITTNHEGFLERMHQAYVNVIPLRGNTLRCAGHQTFLNAMAFGTAVIVTDDGGAEDYVKNDVDGIVVPAGDVVALRSAISQIWENPDLAARLGSAARAVRARLSTESILRLYLRFLDSGAFDDPQAQEFTGEVCAQGSRFGSLSD